MGLLLSIPMRSHDFMQGNNSPKIKIKPIPELIGAFKTTSSKLIHKAGLKQFKWHKSYYDHIIRDEIALYNIRKYIIENPVREGLDF